MLTPPVCDVIYDTSHAATGPGAEVLPKVTQGQVNTWVVFVMRGISTRRTAFWFY